MVSNMTLCATVVRLSAALNRQQVIMPLLVQRLHEMDGKFQEVQFATVWNVLRKI